DRIYLRNLKTLKVLAEQLGARSLFVPQVLNYADFRGSKTSRPWTPHIEDDAMPELLDRFNGIMDLACKSDETDCAVLKGVAAQGWEPEDFAVYEYEDVDGSRHSAHDDGHFSQRGNRKMATFLATCIKGLDVRPAVVH